MRLLLAGLVVGLLVGGLGGFVLAAAIADEQDRDPRPEEAPRDIPFRARASGL